MKFNHDTKKLQDCIEGHEMDMAKVNEIFQKIVHESSDTLGDKKSTAMEYIHEGAKDPEMLCALSIVLGRGVEAIMMMAMVEARTKEAMATMEIDERMPEELKEAIREAKALAKDAGVKETKPEDDEVEDEFEALKRRYQ